jgi:hypothetical protein
LPSPTSTAVDSAKPTSDLRDNDALLDEIAYRSFLFFWQEANPHTGLIKDRANNFGEDDYTVASIAAVGFGLTALCVGQERGWITPEQAFERTLTTLLFFRDEMEHVHGFYYILSTSTPANGSGTQRLVVSTPPYSWPGAWSVVPASRIPRSR